ncbi:hypothetical protein VTN77DRAFT_1848 [Rasamsonia byssochlamydoides]|uniref:uncharacterized protein n=1 Tax=Rasamsonia byssochlamydoides TaxID=89139 RepID=UPI0037448E48
MLGSRATITLGSGFRPYQWQLNLGCRAGELRAGGSQPSRAGPATARALKSTAEGSAPYRAADRWVLRSVQTQPTHSKLPYTHSRPVTAAIPGLLVALGLFAV